MNDHQYALERANLSMLVTLENLNAVLDESRGQPTMSPEDMKEALIHITIALTSLENLTRKLAYLPLESPKKFWQFWK